MSDSGRVAPSAVAGRVKVFAWIMGVLALGTAAAWGFVAVFVRRMVSWKPRVRSVTVTAVKDSRVHLEHSNMGQYDGAFTLRWPGGNAQVGALRAGGISTWREVLTTTGAIPLGTLTVSSYPGLSPDAGGTFDDVLIRSSGRDVPAWQYGPDAATWMIHVHGVRSNRFHTLWSVPAATAAGFTSLVIAYRGAPDGPKTGRHAGMGAYEAGDVVAAIEYAASHGAEKIVLSGWSMGASACLLATEHTPHRDRIVGHVLVAPTISWRHVMRSGARRLGLPQWISSVVEWTITTPLVAQAVGMPVRVDLDALDWATPPARLREPALVFGSRSDTNTPFETLTAFAESNPGLVEMHEVETCIHGWEPNADPDMFRSTLHGWLIARRQ